MGGSLLGLKSSSESSELVNILLFLEVEDFLLLIEAVDFAVEGLALLAICSMYLRGIGDSGNISSSEEAALVLAAATCSLYLRGMGDSGSVSSKKNRKKTK